MLSRLVSPSVIPGYLATMLGVSPVVAKVGIAAISSFGNKGVVAASPSTPQGVMDRVTSGARQLLALGDEVAAGFIIGFVENHERKAELTEILSAISKLPLAYFEGEHADLNDFVKNGLLPFLHVLADPRCDNCGETDVSAFTSAGDATICGTCDHIF